MDLGLTDSVALVTGSSRGLGLAAATALAAEGCRVVLCARGQEALEAAAAGLAPAGADRVLTVAADVSSAAGAELVMLRTLDRFGRIDILVNNVGKAAGTDIAATLARWADRASIEHHELVVVCDTSEQVSIATLAAQGFAATGAVKDRDAGIRLVSHRLQVAGEAPGLTVHPSCVNLINEFGQYVWASKQDSRTKVRYFGDRPVDHHADALDACRYAILELAQSEPPPRLVRTAAGNVYETYE